MAEESDATETEEETKPSGGGIIGIAIIGIAALGGSFAASYFLGGSAAPPPESACLAGDEYAEIMPEEPSYDPTKYVHVEMPEILITVGSAPADRYLKMSVTVSTDKDGTKLIDTNQAILMDAFITYLRSMEMSDFENPRYFSEMREQLSHRAELVLGTAHTGGVLITEFLLR